MTKWLTAHLNDYGEGGISKKGKAYRVYGITILQDRMKITARLILMGDALHFWETKFSVWNRDGSGPLDRASGTVMTFAPVSRKWTTLGRDIKIPLYFIFNRFHIKQSRQGSLVEEIWLTKIQKEMKHLIDVMMGKKE